MNPADTKNLKRLHRQLLRMLLTAGAPIRGRWLVNNLEECPEFNELLDSVTEPITGDQLMQRLIVYLRSAGYITARDTRTHRDQREGLDYTDLEITAKGIGLLNEAVPVDPLIEDARIA